jgi:hypothetical protein
MMTSLSNNQATVSSSLPTTRIAFASFIGTAIDHYA